MSRIAIWLIMASSIFGQINITKISLDVNYVKNYQRFGNPQFSFSPEVKLGGEFFARYFEWDFYTSYWDDGINKEILEVVDNSTYSYSNLSIGSRLTYLPPEMILPVLFSAGVSYNYISRTFMGGFSNSLNESFNRIKLDLGSGAHFKINSAIRIRTEYIIHLPVNSTGEKRIFRNYSFKFGLDYLWR